MADPLDVLTLAEAQNALPGASDAGALARYVTGVSRALDARFGPIVKRAVVGEQHRIASGVRLLLDQRPVVSVEGCTEYLGKVGYPVTIAADPTVTGTYSATLDGDKGVLYRWASGAGRDWAPLVYVDYTAGRYDSTDTVDPKFKDGAEFMLQNLWRKQRGSGDALDMATFAVPRAVEQLLDDELRSDGFA